MMKIGTQVWLPLEKGEIITKYHYEYIPEEKIKHGELTPSKEYFEKGATIVDTHEQYLICSWKSIRNRELRLGFLEKDLQKVKLTIKDIMEGTI